MVGRDALSRHACRIALARDIGVRSDLDQSATRLRAVVASRRNSRSSALAGYSECRDRSAGRSHGDILFGFLEHTGVAGNLTSDAHLAALAIENRAVLASTDLDFARFPGLRWLNPATEKR